MRTTPSGRSARRLRLSTAVDAASTSSRSAAGAHRHSHGPRGCRRSDRERARRDSSRSSAKRPTSPLACKPWQSRTRSLLPRHAAADRRPLRVPRSRRRRGERHRRAIAGVAGAGTERRREPVRGVARIGADPAGRPRRGDRPAVAPLGARQGRRRPGRAGLGRARARQVAPYRGTGRSACTPSRISACAISARPITRTVRCSRSSTSSAGHRGSHATIRPLPSWRSSRPC